MSAIKLESARMGALRFTQARRALTRFRRFTVELCGFFILEVYQSDSGFASKRAKSARASMSDWVGLP